MSRMSPRTLALAALLLCLPMLCGRALAIPFLVSVDTGSLQGTSGFLDLQFNPADAATPAALASVTGFGGNLNLIGMPLLDGDVSGTLQGGLQLRNTTAFNSYFQAVQFGDLLRFVVDFSGAFSSLPSSLGTSFALSLLDAAQQPLLTNDISGSLLRFELLAGDVTFQAFQVNGRAAATVTQVTAPGTGTLLLTGMLLLIAPGLRRWLR